MSIPIVEVLKCNFKIMRKIIVNKEKREEFREIKIGLDRLEGEIHLRFMMNLKIKLIYMSRNYLSYAKIF